MRPLLVGISVALGVLVGVAPAQAHWFHHQTVVVGNPGTTFLPGTSSVVVSGTSAAFVQQPGVSFVQGAALYTPAMVSSIQSNPGVTFHQAYGTTTQAGVSFVPAGVTYVPATMVTSQQSNPNAQAALDPLTLINTLLPLVDKIISLRQPAPAPVNPGTNSGLQKRVTDLEDRMDSIESQIAVIQKKLKIKVSAPDNSGTTGGGKTKLPLDPPVGVFSSAAEVQDASRIVEAHLDSLWLTYQLGKRTFSEMPEADQKGARGQELKTSLDSIKSFLEKKGKKVE